MSKRFSPKFKAEALRLLGAGVSTREAQAQLHKRFREHVGEGTLRGWAKAADAAQLNAGKTAFAALALVQDEVERSGGPTSRSAEAPADVDTYEHVCKRLAEAQLRADQAAADGNHTAAQRFSGDVVKYTLLKARLDKDRKSDTDVVTIPRAELDRARQAMRDRIAALAADLERTGGIVCSHCGREIRISLAKGDGKT